MNSAATFVSGALSGDKNTHPVRSACDVKTGRADNESAVGLLAEFAGAQPLTSDMIAAANIECLKQLARVNIVTSSVMPLCVVDCARRVLEMPFEPDGRPRHRHRPGRQSP